MIERRVMTTIERDTVSGIDLMLFAFRPRTDVACVHASRMPDPVRHTVRRSSQAPPGENTIGRIEPAESSFFGRSKIPFRLGPMLPRWGKQSPSGATQRPFQGLQRPFRGLQGASSASALRFQGYADAVSRVVSMLFRLRGGPTGVCIPRFRLDGACRRRLGFRRLARRIGVGDWALLGC